MEGKGWWWRRARGEGVRDVKGGEQMRKKLEPWSQEPGATTEHMLKLKYRHPKSPNYVDWTYCTEHVQVKKLYLWPVLVLQLAFMIFFKTKLLAKTDPSKMLILSSKWAKTHLHASPISKNFPGGRWYPLTLATNWPTSMKGFQGVWQALFTAFQMWSILFDVFEYLALFDLKPKITICTALVGRGPVNFRNKFMHVISITDK
jgi:hypothetical protein